jgi:hypothetical protein
MGDTVGHTVVGETVGDTEVGGVVGDAVGDTGSSLEFNGVEGVERVERGGGGGHTHRPARRQRHVCGLANQARAELRHGGGEALGGGGGGGRQERHEHALQRRLVCYKLRFKQQERFHTQSYVPNAHTDSSFSLVYYR